ncbi:DNAH [Lepeophtheirus salmonis]|uniref:DNAH n=1 Tax=Lepeophtheirus salmonis TaxID=72036 RepID=A0A7R8CQ36_LEPSM|nr:DNAH [Lepeophtheirus salmonis]CAF2891689.1 DNAH [Lepeophtheirus salmonis]
MSGLLQDKVSTDNGIIMNTVERWPMMIDPQDIANLAFNLDHLFLLENIGDTLDPVLEPLLQKQTFQQGGSVCIKLGESTIEYSKSFKMYITTRYNNPHFPPEISSKISLINFAITTSGLIDQLLGVIIARERPELEEERIVKEIYLRMKNAIKTLSSSKLLANEISEKQSTSQSNKERIEENRNEYLDLAKYAVTLFFTSISLSNINTMYQFSSTWFINIFCTSIDLADKSDELAERLLNIKNHFLKNLYINTSRGLFEVDKVLYSFLLVANLNPDPGFKDSNMWKTFLLNGYNMKEREDHFPASSTLLNEDLRYSVSEEMTSFFNSLWISQDPTSITSSKYDNPFESLTITSYIRPDKTLSSIRKYVVDLLGPTFLSQEQTDIGKSYAESTHATPIIFILGDDVDPTNIIYKFADSMGYGGKKLRIISMGKGLEEKAEETIKESVLTGSWVVLMNCHLIPEWMDDLEYICEGLNKESTNTDFRLWISTRPIKSFSVPTLQISVKIALEESSNLKLNIIRYILSDNSVRKVFDNSSITYKKLVFILAIIHAALNERRIYSQCGWNGNYIFGEQDVELCKFHLESVYQSSTEEISGSALSTLQYLISACSYGGRMEDEWDQRTLDTFIHSILQIDILQLINDLDISGIYHLKDLSDFKTTESYIMNLPTETNHNILRMGEATHYLKNVLEGETFLHKLRLTQREEAKIPESNKKMEDKEDEFIKMRQTMSKILNLLPEEFETTENNSFSEDKILNIVLDQELQKYNDLLDTMKESLESAIMSIDGCGIMTKEIQELLEFIKNDEIPSIWMNMAYPILESLSGFLEDLRLRTEFLLNWQTHGPPKVYWLTALFEPGDFFIAILYLHSLKMGIPFHELTLECKFDQNADEGILVKDLYLVGAHWNDEKVVPVSFDDLDDNSKTVNIPMFQNSEKSGEDNFVIDLNLPSEHSEEECILKGVAILCQKPLDC